MSKVESLIEEEAAKREELSVLKDKEYKAMEDSLIYLIGEEINVSETVEQVATQGK